MGMKKGENFHHPEKGSTIFVEPIRDLAKIAEIKEMLGPRNRAIFTLGINTNLRASDLLAIHVGQVRGLKVGGELVLTEKKTGKKRRITMNAACIEVLRTWMREVPELPDRSPLFIDTTTGRRLSVPSLSRLVKTWCKKAGLKGNYASHSLRKTWGYHQYHTFEVQLPHLVFCFNHSSQKQTLDYLGIQPEEIADVYMNEI